MSLLQDSLYFFEQENEPLPSICTSPRIHVDYAQEYAKKPWRFFDSHFVKK